MLPQIDSTFDNPTPYINPAFLNLGVDDETTDPSPLDTSSLTPEFRKALNHPGANLTISCNQVCINFTCDRGNETKNKVHRISIAALKEADKFEIKTHLITYLKRDLIIDEALEAFKMKLIDWVIEKTFNPELESRYNAALKIGNEIKQKSQTDKSTYRIDLSNLGLTSLPKAITLLDSKKELLIAGNYLEQDSIELVDIISNLQDTDKIKKEIEQQKKISSDPALFLKHLYELKLGDKYPQTTSLKLANFLNDEKFYNALKDAFYASKVKKQDKRVSLTLVDKVLFLYFWKIILVVAAIYGLFSILSKLFKALDRLSGNHVAKYREVLNNLITIHALSYHAGNNSLTMYELCEQSCNAINKTKTNNTLKKIQETLIASSELDVITLNKKIENNELVILPLGFHSLESGHGAALVIYKDKMMICNRGAKGENEEIFEAFEINHKKINIVMLANIIFLHYQTLKTAAIGQNYQSMYLYQAIPTFLQAERIELPHEMNAKSQKVGNCSIASAKAAFQAAVFLLNGQDKDAAILAKKQKKIFSHQLRASSLQAVTSSKIYRFFSFIYGWWHIKKAKAKLAAYHTKLLAT